MEFQMPIRFALYLFGFIRSGPMSAVVAGIATLRNAGLVDGFIGRWMNAWLLSWMGIAALCRRPNTSKSAAGHKIYPYLLRKPPITRPSQVWAMDITFVGKTAPTGLFSDPPHPDGARLHLTGRRAGLVHPPRAVLAGLDHAGGRLLR